MSDVIAPDHYHQHTHPCFLFCCALPGAWSHAFKYAWRAGDKGDKETDWAKCRQWVKFALTEQDDEQREPRASLTLKLTEAMASMKPRNRERLVLIWMAGYGDQNARGELMQYLLDNHELTDYVAEVFE